MNLYAYTNSQNRLSELPHRDEVPQDLTRKEKPSSLNSLHPFQVPTKAT